MKKTPFHSRYQHSLQKSISCEGIGLHSGAAVTLTLKPAEAHSGIQFVRTDLAEPIRFKASAAIVGETKLGTSLTHPSGATLSTIEHLMAAFWGCGIDNAMVYVNGPEIPIMDGSATPFIELIEQAGLRAQSAKRSFIEITKPLKIEMDGSHMEILPYDGFAIEVDIDFKHSAIGEQRVVVDFSQTNFAGAMSNARTFGFLKEVEYLKTIGLARGGSLDNAVVLDDTKILNPAGLRSDDEFVQHKALDLVGDLFLSGGRIRGLVRTFKPGHTINTHMARRVMQFAAQQTKNALAAPRFSVSKPARVNEHVAEVAFA